MARTKKESAEQTPEEAAKQLESMGKSSKELECASCKTRIAGAVEITRFPCPQCGFEIIRCGKCRRIVAQYTCPKCGFVGPN